MLVSVVGVHYLDSMDDILTPGGHTRIRKVNAEVVILQPALRVKDAARCLHGLLDADPLETDALVGALAELLSSGSDGVSSWRRTSLVNNAPVRLNFLQRR